VRKGRKMSDKEIAQNVLTLVNKGYMTDYGDTDYFYDADEEDIDKAYEFKDELLANGEIAFRKKYDL
jgi:hypothetical protein